MPWPNMYGAACGPVWMKTRINPLCSLLCLHIGMRKSYKRFTMHTNGSGCAWPKLQDYKMQWPWCLNLTCISYEPGDQNSTLLQLKNRHLPFQMVSECGSAPSTILVGTHQTVLDPDSHRRHIKDHLANLSLWTPPLSARSCDLCAPSAHRRPQSRPGPAPPCQRGCRPGRASAPACAISGTRTTCAACSDRARPRQHPWLCCCWWTWRRRCRRSV